MPALVTPWGWNFELDPWYRLHATKIGNPVRRFCSYRAPMESTGKLLSLQQSDLAANFFGLDNGCGTAYSNIDLGHCISFLWIYGYLLPRSLGWSCLEPSRTQLLRSIDTHVDHGLGTILWFVDRSSRSSL